METIGNFIVSYTKTDYLKAKTVTIFLILLIEFTALRKYLKIQNHFDMRRREKKIN